MSEAHATLCCTERTEYLSQMASSGLAHCSQRIHHDHEGPSPVPDHDVWIHKANPHEPGTCPSITDGKARLTSATLKHCT